MGFFIVVVAAVFAGFIAGYFYSDGKEVVAAYVPKEYIKSHRILVVEEKDGTKNALLGVWEGDYVHYVSGKNLRPEMQQKLEDYKQKLKKEA